MVERQCPTMVARLAIFRHVLGPRLAAEILLQITQLAADLQPACGHQARRDGGVVVRRDVPVIGDEDLRAGAVREPEHRRQETGLADTLERELVARQVEHRVLATSQYGCVSSNSLVGVLVDLDVVGLKQPIRVVEVAGGVPDPLVADQASGAIKAQTARGTFAVYRGDAERGVVDLALAGLLVEYELRARDLGVSITLDDIALPARFTGGDVPAQHIAEQFVPALADVSLTGCRDALVDGSLYPPRLDLEIRVAELRQ